MNLHSVSGWKPRGLVVEKTSASADAFSSLVSRRQFGRTAGATALLGALHPLLSGPSTSFAPVPIPGGSPALGGAYHVFGPAAFDPMDAEPGTITNHNGFVGLAYLSGMVTQTNAQTGVTTRLPFVDADMRFMEGDFRGTDGRVHQGAFAFV